MATAVAPKTRLKEHRLTQFHASDREVLAWLRKAEDADGFAESSDVAAQVWPRLVASGNGEATAVVQAAGQRLSHMRRLGIVDSERQEGKIKWWITEEGDALLSGRLRAAVERGLDEMDGASSVVAMSVLSQRIRSDDMYGALMVRAFRYTSGSR